MTTIVRSFTLLRNTEVLIREADFINLILGGTEQLGNLLQEAFVLCAQETLELLELEEFGGRGVN